MCLVSELQEPDRPALAELGLCALWVSTQPGSLGPQDSSRVYSEGERKLEPREAKQPVRDHFRIKISGELCKFRFCSFPVSMLSLEAMSIIFEAAKS